MSKFCINCGNELKSEEKFCSSCGCATLNQSSNNVSNSINQNKKQYQQNMLVQLSQKNQTNAIIWIALGIVQIIVSIYTIAYYGFFSGICILAVGVLNIFSGYKDFTYSKELLQKPVAIISRYESMTPIVISLAYNLRLGAIVGIGGNIYEITIRSFVMNNKEIFKQAENRNS